MTVYRPPPFRPVASAPITIRVPRAPTLGGRKKHSRRRSGGGEGNTKKQAQNGFVGGMVVGFIEKGGYAQKLPQLPMIGTKGTIALAAYFLGGKKKGIARDVCIAAATMAGYEFGKEGKISGDD